MVGGEEDLMEIEEEVGLDQAEVVEEEGSNPLKRMGVNPRRLRIHCSKRQRRNMLLQEEAEGWIEEEV